MKFYFYFIKKLLSIHSFLLNNLSISRVNLMTDKKRRHFLYKYGIVSDEVFDSLIKKTKHTVLY
jgi:hypothetical protein